MIVRRAEAGRAIAAMAIAITGCTFNSDGLGGGRGSGPSSGSASADSTSTTTPDGTTSISGATSGDATDASGPTADTTGTVADTTDDGPGPTTSSDSDPSAGDTHEVTGDPPTPCDTDNGGCHADATCTADGDAVQCDCNVGFVGDGSICATAPSFETLRVNLGCETHNDCGGPQTCTTDALAVADAPLGGDDGVEYQVTLRIRGVVEVTTYTNGDCDGFWCEGGTGVGAPWNEITLHTDAPSADYHPNQGEAGTLSLFAIDEERSVRVVGGAQITLRMDGNGTCTIANDDDLVVPDIPPAPQAFDGQFVQIDLVSATVSR